MSFTWLIISALIVWLSIITWILVAVFKLLNRLTKSSKLADLMDLQKKMDNRISFWNLYKFNPFNNTGGEQSFVLTLLDGHKNGIVLTVLNGRGVTRFYAKKIENGTSKQQLSDEEKQCIKDSL